VSASSLHELSEGSGHEWPDWARILAALILFAGMMLFIFVGYRTWQGGPPQPYVSNEGGVNSPGVPPVVAPNPVGVPDRDQTRVPSANEGGLTGVPAPANAAGVSGNESRTLPVPAPSNAAPGAATP
jgi:hypothetical protein